MKTLQPILTLIALITFIQETRATAQFPDYMIYQGDTLPIYSNPLESYFELHSRPDSIFERYGFNSTTSWRGYIGYWELKNDSLFLLELRGASSSIDLSLIFHDLEVGGKIFADWYDQTILHPHGKLIHYEHMGYLSVYEFERAFSFSGGLLTDILDYDNSKSRKSEYTENRELLKAFIRENIDYSNIADEPFEEVRVYIEIFSVTKDGKIDSVRIARGYDEAYDKEAMRVVRSIPEWDVYYRHGKQVQFIWAIPVVFEKGE